MSLNKCMFIGRLGRDPEVKYTQDGTPVANFSLATSKHWTKNGEKHEQTQWHNIVAWSKLAETAKNYLAKGRECCIEGEITYRKWEKDGQSRTTTDIVASNIVLLGSKQDKPKDDGFGPERYQQPTEDESIPF